MDTLMVVADDITFYVADISAIDGVGSIPGNSASQHSSIISKFDAIIVGRVTHIFDDPRLISNNCRIFKALDKAIHDHHIVDRRAKDTKIRLCAARQYESVEFDGDTVRLYLDATNFARRVEIAGKPIS